MSFARYGLVGMLRSCDHTGKGAVRDALGRTGIERCAASSRAPGSVCRGPPLRRLATSARCPRRKRSARRRCHCGERCRRSARGAPRTPLASASPAPRWGGPGEAGKSADGGAWAVTPLALLRSNTSTRILQSRSIACARGLNSSPHGIISSSAAPSHLAGSRSAAACVKWQKIGHVENAAIAGWTRAVSSPLDRDEDEISKRC